VSVTEPISAGFVQEFLTRTTSARGIGWKVAATDTQIRQQFKFTYTGDPLKLDIKVESTVAPLQNPVPPVKVYVASEFKDPDTYTVVTTDNTTTITLDKTYFVGDTIEVLALSNQSSAVAFYQVPINLEKNPLN
jgi:hypothetical protein